MAAEASVKASGDIETPGGDLRGDPFLAGPGGGSSGSAKPAGGDASRAGAPAAAPGGASSAPGVDGAAPSDDVAAAEASTESPRAGCSHTSAFVLIIMVWQAIVLRKHSKSFPGSIFSGEHNALSAPCEKLYWVLNWSLFLSIFMIALDVSIFCVAKLPGLSDALPGCLHLVKFGEAVGNFLKLFVGLVGFWVVAVQVKSSQVGDCSELYSCAWWCFLGFLLLPCLVCVFLVGVHAGASAAHQGAYPNTPSDSLLVQGPSYGTTAHPAQPAALPPFSGQGHKLGPAEAETSRAQESSAASG